MTYTTTLASVFGALRDMDTHLIWNGRFNLLEGDRVKLSAQLGVVRAFQRRYAAAA